MVLYGSYQQDTSTCTNKNNEKFCIVKICTLCYKFYPSKPKISFNITNKYYQFNVNQISFPIEMLRLSQENIFVNFNLNTCTR